MLCISVRCVRIATPLVRHRALLLERLLRLNTAHRSDCIKVANTVRNVFGRSLSTENSHLH